MFSLKQKLMKLLESASKRISEAISTFLNHRTKNVKLLLENEKPLSEIFYPQKQLSEKYWANAKHSMTQTWRLS